MPVPAARYRRCSTTIRRLHQVMASTCPAQTAPEAAMTATGRWPVTEDRVDGIRPRHVGIPREGGVIMFTIAAIRLGHHSIDLHCAREHRRRSRTDHGLAPSTRGAQVMEKIRVHHLEAADPPSGHPRRHRAARVVLRERPLLVRDRNARARRRRHGRRQPGDDGRDGRPPPSQRTQLSPTAVV